MVMALSWTNTRARMENYGLGGKHSDLNTFTLKKNLQNTGLYLDHALPLSSQAKIKFYPSKDDPVNGRDFIHHNFGYVTVLAIRIHKKFK